MDYFRAIIKYIKERKPTPEQLAREKVRLCNSFKLARIPSNFEILLRATDKELPQIERFLMTKPTRTISGVAVVAVMTEPRKCPHGRCIMCPGGPSSNFGDVPQSYTGREPATRRAIRNKFDAYLQVFNRLEQYVLLGHNIEKVELIIMGGTFPAYPWDYQREFVASALKGLNDFGKLFVGKEGINLQRFKSFFELPGDISSDSRVARIQKKILKLKGKPELKREQKRNESARVRCVAMCIETRPDYCQPEHIARMLELGCTRVELGVQTLDDSILNKIERGHTVEHTIKATRELRESFLKVGYHIMLGLPGSTPEKDIDTIKTLFSDERFRPDFLKIYPCLVVRGTKLYKMWRSGEYKPLSISDAVKIITKAKRYVPEYCRIMRVQRDIPIQVVSAGPKMTNLRQYILAKNLKCRCIRCREYGTRVKQGLSIGLSKCRLRVLKYRASGGVEYFIQYEEPETDTLLGFCRLRVGQNTGVRELHVYGPAVGFRKQRDGGVQHLGIGTLLLQKAEEIAKNSAANKIYVISGIGVRNYYRKLGYRKCGAYMMKRLI
ncbi:tRNA uridine(34) 5-carboxymethylaminomethyl modification radical SAM/GNAT enzyme Elp3 [Candidatus Woesearchaeota archaeon]|nr:tRNA uridine(34) 5-carboxymethylaminomethyl modification radical SAM/GNAT enzyme Elp3 [Candidatus Woesearchaeota archaeon]RLE41945.1 MAG: tRNA uridine(34) 5-carboxymethylaminomethyl modification radical SAM/GNAT enzyme Elp3 [Candidatus Woesearchaeota archaeon]